MEFFTGLDKWIQVVIIGVIAGRLAALLMREKRIGILGYLIVGVIGSFIGFYLFGMVGFAVKGPFAQLIAALFGALVLIVVLRLVRR